MQTSVISQARVADPFKRFRYHGGADCLYRLIVVCEGGQINVLLLNRWTECQILVFSSIISAYRRQFTA
jgi:hypothetical protein